MKWEAVRRLASGGPKVGATSYSCMADALRLAPCLLILLLIAVAAAPAAAEPHMPRLKFEPVAAGNFDRPAWARHDPVLGRRLLQDEISPTWTLPFGPRASERERRGLSFSVRPSHGLKAMAKIRF